VVPVAVHQILPAAVHPVGALPAKASFEDRAAAAALPVVEPQAVDQWVVEPRVVEPQVADRWAVEPRVAADRMARKAVRTAAVAAVAAVR
jgi:hypothetical protein